MRQESETSLTALPFAVKWPTELQIKPVLEFKISKGVTCRVFEKEYKSTATRDGKENDEVKTGHLIVYTSDKTGQHPKALGGRHYSYRDGDTYRDWLSVRLEVEHAAAMLSPTKKASKEEYDPED